MFLLLCMHVNYDMAHIFRVFLVPYILYSKFDSYHWPDSTNRNDISNHVIGLGIPA